MYTVSSRIRYSEVNAEGELKLTSLIDHLQDCSTFQSEDVGYGVRRLTERGYAWVVNAWQIEILELPMLGDRVVVGTNPYEIREFLGLRNFFIDDAAGRRLVVANSVWSFLNIAEGTVARVPEAMKEAYGLGEKLDMPYLSRKLPFPKEGATREVAPVEVHTSHLDTNRHVNNGQFIRIALDADFGEVLPRVRRLRAEYKKQAHLRDVLFPGINVREAEDGAEIHTIALRDEAGEPYCTVEVTL